MATVLANEHYGFFCNRDYLTGNTDAEALAAAIADATANGGRVWVAPKTGGYSAGENEVIAIPFGVAVDGNYQQWTVDSNTADSTLALFKPVEGAHLMNVRGLLTGTGTSSLIQVNGALEFSRDELTYINNIVCKGDAVATNNHTMLHLLADGNDVAPGERTYVNWVRADNLWSSQLLHSLHCEAKNGTGKTCYVNGNRITNVHVDQIKRPFKFIGESDAACDRNQVTAEIQSVGPTERLVTCDFASQNKVRDTNAFDWTLSNSDTGIEFNQGSFGNRIYFSGSNFDPDLFVQGTEQDSNTFVDESVVEFPGPGVMQVSTGRGIKTWRANANDPTRNVSNTPIVEEMLAFAVANMPCVVDVGPGKIYVDRGFNLNFPLSSRGFTMRGAGGGVTQFVFDNDGAAIGGGRQVMFQAEPVSAPSTDSERPKDIVFEGIGFDDVDPAAHADAEETHGIIAKHLDNVLITKCAAFNIGDEGFDFTDCRNFKATENFCRNTPSVGTAGAGISVGLGCTQGILANNTLCGSSSDGTQSVVSLAQGIGCAVVASPDASDIRDVIIANNTIRDFPIGVLANVADTTNNSDILDLTINANTITNCDNGVDVRGSNGIVKRLSVTGNKVTEFTNRGIAAAVAASANVDYLISENTFASTQAGDLIAINVNGTNGSMLGNKISDTARGIYAPLGTNNVVKGGSLTRCGGINLEGIDFESSRGNHVEGVIISESRASQSDIKGAETITNCVLESIDEANIDASHVNWWGRRFMANQTVEGCDMIGGIRFLDATAKPSVLNTRIVYPTGVNATGSNSWALRAEFNDMSFIGNHVDTSNATALRALRVDTAITGTIVTGNRMDWSSTSGGSFDDLGTGTKADVDNNVFG